MIAALSPIAPVLASFAVAGVGVVSVSFVGAAPLLFAVVSGLLAFFRRRRAPEAPASTEAPPPATGVRRSQGRPGPAEGSSEVNPSVSGGRAGVPDYYEGPPVPRAPVARRPGSSEGASSRAQLQDLDAVLAQLDRLSEQIRRRGASRPAKETSPSPPEPDPPPAGR